MRVLALLALAGVMTSADIYAGFTGYWVEAIATAYSPHDAIDGHHWSTKDHVTANGTDWRETPYGIAVPYRAGRALMVRYGTRIVVPAETGYLAKTRPADRVFTADDTGGVISRRTVETGKPHIDLRFKSEASARSWVGPTGRRTIRVFVVTGVAEAEKVPDYMLDPFYDPNQ